MPPITPKKPATPTNKPAMPAIPTTPATPSPTISPSSFGTPGVAERSEFKGSGKPKAPASPRQITREMIERRAYEIYASRGYAPGDPTADWLEAERQLKAGL